MSNIATQDTWVNTDLGRLFVRSWQPESDSTLRTPIVMQHDSLGCIALWRDLPERMAAATGRRVVAYDRLGFGRSDPHPGKLGKDLVQAQAHGDFRTVIDTLGISRFVAFGHSIGGGMSIACAAIHAPSCIGLITESCQVYAEPHTLEGVRQAKTAFAEPGQLDRLKKYHGEKAAWVLDAWIETWLSPDFVDWTLEPSLRAITCPVLGIHGDCDEYGSLEHLHRIEACTGATAVVMHGCGHIPHREKPDEFLTVIRDWLQDVA